MRVEMKNKWEEIKYQSYINILANVLIFTFVNVIVI